MKYLLAILAIGVLILVHELGHFIMAKINKVKVISFSIGMGPKILKYKGKETEYCLSLLPVGGYVEMLGAQEESDEEGSLSSKSPFRRITVMIAGVVMNFILAIVLFTTIICHFGYTDTSINKLTEGGPLIEAGLLEGDVVKEVNGTKITTFTDIGIEMSKATGDEIELKYDRAGEEYQVAITPSYLEDEKRYIIGATFDFVEEPTLMQGVKQSFKQSWTLISQTLSTLTNLVTGKGNFKTDLGGPVTVINLSAGAAEAGIWELMNLVAMLSVSLAVFNALPFPVLDGGWTLLYIIEIITRRKVPTKVVNVLNGAGWVLLMGLMVAVTIKDLIFPAAY